MFINNINETDGVAYLIAKSYEMISITNHCNSYPCLAFCILLSYIVIFCYRHLSPVVRGP